MDNGWIDLDAMRELIKARFAVRGQPTAFAAEVGMVDEIILGFLRGARPPADTLLTALGWERQIFYRRVDPCPCHACAQERVAADPGVQPAIFDFRLARMFLCETCGNKRCPHARDHRNKCSGSNELGQAGSGYENVPAFEQPA